MSEPNEGKDLPEPNKGEDPSESTWAKCREILEKPVTAAKARVIADEHYGEQECDCLCHTGGRCGAWEHCCDEPGKIFDPRDGDGHGSKF